MPPSAFDLPLRGIFLYVSQVACFLVISMTVKSLAPYFAVTELLLVRFVFALLVVLAVIGPKRGSGFFKTRYPIDHMIRTCCGMVALGLSFVALSGAFIANATAVILSAPIIAVVLAFFVLHEQIRPSRMIAVIIGFCGILYLLCDLGFPALFFDFLNRNGGRNHFHHNFLHHFFLYDHFLFYFFDYLFFYDNLFHDYLRIRLFVTIVALGYHNQ